MRAGIALQNQVNAGEAGRLAAEEALKRGQIRDPHLALAFCSGNSDAEAFFGGLRSVLGPSVPILGGSAIGVIANDQISYEGHPAGVAVLERSDLDVRIAVAGDLDRDEVAAGRRIGEQLAGGAADGSLLIFYDSIREPPTPQSPPVMNPSPGLLRGLTEALGQELPAVGAGVIGDYQFGATVQFLGDRVGRQCAVAARLGGALQPFTQIMHGCTPMDGTYHTITRMTGSVIHALDGRPIVDVIDEVYGDRSWREQMPVRRLAIGVNHGDRYGELREEAFVNRLIAGALPDGSGIVMFEPDLAVGTEVLFMLREGRTMIESARRNTRRLVQRIAAAGRTPRFALYVSCAGRTTTMSDTVVEEADEVRTVLNEHNVPLFGFYSGVEIGPLLGSNRGLDWTGVLLVLAER